MKTRKDLKKEIVQEIAADKKQSRIRAEEIAALPRNQRRTLKAKERTKRKIAKKLRKQQIKQMPKIEKRQAKRHDKIYRKVKARPRRAVVWTAVLLILSFGIYNIAPVIGDVARLLSIDIDTSSEQGASARAHGEEIAEIISDEGIVLLKNTDNSLPLEDKKVNVFGLSSFHIRYGGGGSGAADQSRAVNLYQGLKNAGIEYNQSLYEVTASHEDNTLQEGSTGLFQVIGSLMQDAFDEPPVDYLSDDIINTAKDFSENALIVISSAGVEASDFTPEELKLTPNRVALIDKITENFKNVIIIINAGNAMELGFLEDYETINGALWIGNPGPRGCQSLGNILAGNINPSGRLVNTYAYDATANPASANFGNYKFDNIDNMGFINYEEGIYIGYRFYETYYEGNESAYKEAVQFPFGYGLSYTDFDWKIIDSNITESDVSIEIKIENKGDIAGKDVVQVYYSAPYTPGGIEKSAIELISYQKTDLILPGAEQTINIEFPIRDMASYDMLKEQAYVLEEGSYEIKVGKNVHDIVDFITFNVEQTIVYKSDNVTGTEILNQFDYANGDLTYLSRSDWTGTWPNISNTNFEASQEILTAFNSEPEKPLVNLPLMGAENNLKLEDLKDLDYEDPKWQLFLDQFTVEEMRDLFVEGGYSTHAIERLGIPQATLLDGPAGISFFFGNITAASYPTEIVIASTWNDDLAYKMGEAVGMEANAYNVHGWYAPGMNLHRTAMGGRNFEYFSEDPLLSGKMSAGITRGAQSRDIMVFMKHFALNEQEVNARTGVSVWANEQAIREIYLKPFEITVKEADVTGVMSSFILIGHKWSGGNPELLQNVLRNEWGFVGTVTTDAVLGSFMDVSLAARYGNDLMLAALPSASRKSFDNYYKQDPAGMAHAVRDRIHNICYSLVNYTNLFD